MDEEKAKILGLRFRPASEHRNDIMGISTAEVGCRVYFEGEYATVLYIGPIDEQEGTWLGVEWDNPSRGKHSGTYKNTSYFETVVPNAGSFIKISKADLGISFPTALKMKYAHEDSSLTPNIINLPQKTGPERHIEMVGMKKIMGKQSNFSSLTEVVLSRKLVSSSGAPDELKDALPNVQTLDLSENLLYSWETVHEIVKQLTKLKTLILSKNKLQIPKRPKYQECYKGVKTLVLNHMGYSFSQVIKCGVMWPFIEELSIQNNNIAFLEVPPASVFMNLSTLSLDNNAIDSWIEICKLGRILSLKELHLDNTDLEFISFPSVSSFEKTVLFEHLEILFLRDNKLKKWQDISELNKLKRLKELMISNNPVVLSVTPETARQYIIAKISGLQKLNRTQIENSERKGAEFDYLKTFYTDYHSDACSKDGFQSDSVTPFLILHPTYPELVKKHGAAEESEVQNQSTLIKDNLVSVQFSIPKCGLSLTKKLPGDMSIAKLKILAKRLFKIRASEIKLAVIHNEDDSQRTELDNNWRELSFYSLSDKDKIVIEW